MSLALFFLHFFGVWLVFCAGMIVFSKNPVYAIFYLVLLFCNGAGYLILLQAEFLSFVYIVVYIGAIAVLFLFVIMMLNITVTRLSNLFLFGPISFSFALLLFFELFFIVFNFKTLHVSNLFVEWNNLFSRGTSMEIIGTALFSYNFSAFLLSGFILLLAMLGSIFLAVQKKIRAKRQDAYLQSIRILASNDIIF